MDAPHRRERRVDLGGRTLNLVEQRGTDAEPVVVLLGGCGVASYHWDQVRARLPGRTVLVPDRPGLRGTRWPGTLPQLGDEVATLTALVAEVDRPVVLVAHSMAGLHAEAYLRTGPTRIAGLVLVDSSVEWDPQPPPADARRLRLAQLAYGVTRRVPPVRSVGSLVDRVVVAAQSHRTLREAPSERGRRTYADPEAIAGVLAEAWAYDRQIWDLAELRARTPWPRVPTRVLVAMRGSGQRWLPCQRKLAHRLGGELVELAGSRHLVMLDQPDEIVAAVEAVAAQDPRTT